MNTDEQVFIGKAIRQLQIVVVALVTGVLAFIAATIFLRWSGQFAMNGQVFDMLAYAGLAGLAVVIPLQLVLLGMIDSSIRSKLTAQNEPLQVWFNAFSTRTIIGCALIEGVAFFCIIGALLSGQPWGLIAGALAAVTMIALHFPTEPKFESYMERQRGMIS